MAESHKCSTPGCGKPSKMMCPTCIKLGLPPSYFCGADCFKGYWAKHKGYHSLMTDMLKASLAPSTPVDPKDFISPNRDPSKFKGYKFTGSLRPAAVSPMMSVPLRIAQPDYAITSDPLSEYKDSGAIKVYSAEEIEGVRVAARLAREVLDEGAAMLKVGVTGEEIDRVIYEATIARDSYPSPLNYRRFPKSVCISPNEVVCHGIPDARPLAPGDIVNLDVTVYHKGYHADLNETYLIGEVDSRSLELVETAYDCLAKAIAISKPGTMYRELGAVIQKRASLTACSVVKTYCGHGIGQLFHTAPNVPHYKNNKAQGVMKPGHIFTIEPMINVGDSADQLWPDDWTAVTRDGSRSAQFEHTIVITETGCEILSARQTASRTDMAWDLAAIQR